MMTIFIRRILDLPANLLIEILLKCGLMNFLCIALDEVCLTKGSLELSSGNRCYQLVYDIRFIVHVSR